MPARNFSLAAAALAALLIAPLSAQADDAMFEDSVNGFWDNISALCGKAFAGEATRAPAGSTAFEGLRLVMHVRACEENRIRIPLAVGDNLSRTWVLTRHEDGRLELRHDHRHEDGSDEDVTMYGGFTPNTGTRYEQIFPTDARTMETLPGSYPNVWFMGVTPGEAFVYAVDRLGTDRGYRFEFDLTVEVDAPPAPWGWLD
jgi:hypothetical protein